MIKILIKNFKRIGAAFHAAEKDFFDPQIRALCC